MNKQSMVILLVGFVTAMIAITAFVAVTKPDMTKSVVLQIIKYK